MKQRYVQDLSELPTTDFGTKSPIWWGTLAFCALEGMGFALAAGAYLYLRQINPNWPIAAPPPDHWAGTAILVLLLLSLWPNAMVDRDARHLRLRRVQFWLILMSVIGLLVLAIRAWEFTELRIRWDENAYGSITWFVLGLHATHILTDLGDTVVLTALMFTRHVSKKRFSDVSDNAFYWYFVVASWIPLYALLYGVPRL
jgi:heme/copper-type cytochrome/quinol oxidase subunit 3